VTAPPHRTRVKFCGLTRLEDAEAAVEAGAWALGVILWPGSPRACEPAEAARIARALRRRAEVAGVFVNAPLDEVARAVDALGLTMVQLHGSEGPAFCAEVARRTGARVIKAARVRARADVQALEPFHTDFHLYDTHRAGHWGGTGETFDWELTRLRRTGIPLILSGGLNPGNAGAAVAAVRPYAVDVASGTEAAPGVKDHALLRAFAAGVAEADATATAAAAAPEGAA
jgi:phosphoribosylanthranilate isomerase